MRERGSGNLEKCWRILTDLCARNSLREKKRVSELGLGETLESTLHDYETLSFKIHYFFLEAFQATTLYLCWVFPDPDLLYFLSSPYPLCRIFLSSDSLFPSLSLPLSLSRIFLRLKSLPIKRSQFEDPLSVSRKVSHKSSCSLLLNYPESQLHLDFV